MAGNRDLFCDFSALVFPHQEIEKASVYVAQEMIYSQQSVEQFHRIHHHFALDNLFLPGDVQFLCIHVRLKVTLFLPPGGRLGMLFQMVCQFLILTVDDFREVAHQWQEPIPL